MDYREIIEYWFSDRVLALCFGKDPAFDEEIRQRFTSLYQLAIEGGLSHWREAPEGRLAEIIVLDQFSRNMFRESHLAFAYDGLARDLTREAVKVGADKQLSPGQRAFLYMPLMHSESGEDHELALQLFASHPQLENNLGYEIKHKAIIDRFGRYPHRNEALGRESTPEEIAFLLQPGSSF
jgi:uncharacterized protein (DUF924 family)